MNNNFFQMIQQMQNVKNPQQMFMGMLQNNPQMQQQIQTIQNMSGGKSIEQTVKQLAKQQGISEQQLMQVYNSLANKR